MSLAYVKTVVALVNSMIGSAILILPIIFVQNGILLSLIVVILAAICSCYSNVLSLQHMADDEFDFKDTIARHNNNPREFPWFSLFVFLSTQLLFYLYFNLIMKQWTGLLYTVTWLIPYLPYLTLVTLIIATIIIRKMHLGVTLMAFGIVSVVFTVFFYFWMFTSRPEGNNQFPLVKGESLSTLVGLMIQAFCIQNIFVETLREHPNPKQRNSIICVVYAVGALIYFFIGALGGYGILNRQPIILGAKTIMGYFYADKWQPCLLQLIYLVHLYSVWPQFQVTNAIRLTQILDIEQSETKMNIYLVFSPCMAFACYMFNVNLQTFIGLNGGVCLFFALFAIPIYTHVKCRYLHDKGYCVNEQRVYELEWEQGNKKCEEERESMTSWGKVVDISILVLMGLFALTSITITLKTTFFGGGRGH